nr:reverse transcriptase domain-containing protein [Tanacetum cinerariifolium]
MSFPSLGDDKGTERPMIIEADIGGHMVQRMYVDGGSASKILYEHCFNRLRSEIRNQMVPATTPLIGFSGEIKWPLGKITLLVKIGDEEHSTLAWMDFVVVRASSPYNRIIKRPCLKQIQAVPSTTHGMLKFPVKGGVLILRSGKIIPIECAMVFRPEDWRMCVDFKDLNKACPKDGYPLPEIDWKSDFLWTEKAEFAFKQMKELIEELPMLTAPVEKEELIVYLAASREAVSDMLMMEGGTKQIPIYFINRALKGSKINYTSMKKLVLALLHASKRLRQPRVSVKGKILADFIVERLEEESSDTLMEAEEELPAPWILFTDGSSCVDGSRARMILTNLEGMEFTYALWFQFDATNNEAEYEALIAGLQIAKQMGVKNLQANVDSRLVANQENGTYVAKEKDMIKYLQKVKALTSTFREFSIKQVPRSENKKADVLSKISSTSFAHLSKQVLVEELKDKSINEVEVLVVVEEEGDTWMTPIQEYLVDETFQQTQRMREK